jgi:hypothetical protein
MLLHSLFRSYIGDFKYCVAILVMKYINTSNNFLSKTPTIAPFIKCRPIQFRLTKQNHLFIDRRAI